MFEQRSSKQRQQELWIVVGELPSATPDAFYKRVNRPLEQMDFAPQMWSICKPAYAEASKGGRPSIDPVVYLKMLNSTPCIRCCWLRCKNTACSKDARPA